MTQPTVGIFIIAHAPLASALKTAAMHTFPEAAGEIAVYDVPLGADTARYEAEAEAALLVLGAGSVLMLTDVLGATPANLAGRMVRRGNRRALAGVNVSMLWRALNYRQLPLDDLLVRARDGGMSGIQPVNTPSPQNQPSRGATHDSQHRHHQQ